MGFHLEQGGRRRPEDEIVLMTRVRELHQQTKGVYGSRRIAGRLQGMGYPVGRHRDRSLIQKAGVSVKRSRRYRMTTNSRHHHPVTPNLLNRQFDINGPDKVWASDITYLWTREGWLYLAVVMDIYSRKIIGWATSDRITADLAARALRMALGRRRPGAGLIHST
ncbi:MAG: IS3 family transposase [Dehalococcoidia bacterium]|nr:IS3 family transposase [Dehalococcoidia bacterium]